MSDQDDEKCRPGSLEHALFRTADQLQHVGNAEHRKAAVMERLAEPFVRLLEWLMKPKE